MDFTQYLEPISEQLPSGDNLEDLDDMDFSALEILVPINHEMGMFDSDEEEINWSEVNTKALALLERSKDIRTLLYLTQAQLHLKGFEGFFQAIELLASLTINYWDSIYPLLDHDDNDDPIERVNALKILGDSYSFFNILKTAPIADAKGFGRLSFRDCELAKGNISPVEGEKVPEEAYVHAIFMDTEKEILLENIEKISQIIDTLETFDAYLLETIPADAPTEIKALIKVLIAIQKTINTHAQEREDWAIDNHIISDEIEVVNTLEDNHSETHITTKIQKKGINNREDVIRNIEEICQYYEKNEPSSPVPLLLQRAKRLVDKDFMEIIKDMAEDALSEISNITGVVDEDDN